MMKSLRLLALTLLAVALAAVPARAQGRFGGTVAVAGDRVLVGEPGNQIRPGTVYVYDMRDGAWVEVSRITAPDGHGGDGFGSTMVTDGETLLVSADAGVHVFTRSGGAWTRQGGLDAPTTLGDDGDFGAALALSGDVALVGAPGRADETGAFYVFRRSGGSWGFAEEVTPDGAAAGGRFASALALDGDRVVVGAPGAADGSGAVHVYRLAAGGGATHLAELRPEGLQRARLGSAVALRGDRILAGAPQYGGQLGGVFEFAPDDEGGWTVAGRLLPFDGAGRTGFGAALALRDGEVWVGAPGMDAAYVFRDEEGSWRRAARVAADGARTGFAESLALGESGVVAFGMPGADFRAGQASVYARAAGGGWNEVSRLASEVEGYPAVTGDEVRCSEEGEAGDFACSQVDLLGFLPVQELGGDRGVEVNDVWGWTDGETGREYALVGMTNQTAFVDVTDPGNPVYLGRLPLTEGARPNVWRDIKVYRDHAFIVSDGAGQHGMQVFDLTRLRDFDGEPTTFEADVLYDRIASAHNIVVNPETGFAYSVGSSSGGETCGGGLHMIDVRDPENPTFAGCFSDPLTGRASTGYSHDAQCVTYHGPDAEHQGREICFGANETALSIADVTDKDHPVALSRASYPNVGYTHQGWLDEEQRYFYLDDELDEIQGNAPRTRTLIWDVVDLDDPQLVGEFQGTTAASDHNLYVRGDVMYQSDYLAGLRVIDISDREHPVEIGWFDTVPYGDNSAGFGGSWSNYPFFPSGNVIVTSGNEGLFIVRPRTTKTVS